MNTRRCPSGTISNVNELFEQKIPSKRLHHVFSVIIKMATAPKRNVQTVFDIWGYHITTQWTCVA